MAAFRSKAITVAAGVGLLLVAVVSAQGGCHGGTLRGGPVALPPPHPALALPTPQAAVAVRTPPAPAAPRASPRSPAFTLEGGTRLIVERDRLAGTVAVALFVRAGAESEPTPGLRHLLERTLLDRELPAGALAARLRERGSEVVSFTGPDYTSYQAVLPRAGWSAGLDLIRQLLDEPTVPAAAAVERQRHAIAEELTAAPPDGEALRRLLAAIYPGHPYQRPPSGTLDSLAALREDDLRAFYRRHYRQDSLTLVVVGDLQPQEVLALATERLAAPRPTAGSSLSPPLAIRPPMPGLRLNLLPNPKSGSPGELLLGFAIPSAALADLPALELISSLLATGSDQAAERQRSFLLSGCAPGALVVRTTLRPTASSQSVDETLRASIGAALRLGQREVPLAELGREKRRLLAAAALRSETPAGRVQRLGAFALLGIDESAYEQRLAGLTPEALREAASRYLKPDNLTVSIVAPARLPADESHLRTIAATAARVDAEPLADPAAVASDETGSARAQLYRLRSGARLILLPSSQVKTVAIAALFAGGQRLEEERSAGLHELLARAWPRANRTRSGEPVEEEERQLAATFSSHVGPDSFGLKAQLQSADLRQGLALVRDSIESPLLLESDLERGRRELLIELGGRHGGQQQLESEAAHTAWRLFKRSLLGAEPYATQPTAQSLMALHRHRLLDFYHQHYTREKLVLALVGDFAPQAVLAELEPWLGAALPLAGAELALARRPSIGASPPLPPPSTATQSFQWSPAQQAHLVVGFRAPGGRAAVRPAVEVLAELLLDGRLERALQSRRGLVTSVAGQLSAGLEPGYLAFYLAAAPARLEAAEAALRDELHRLIDHPIAAEELAAARERLVARRALSGQHRRERALQLAQAVALGLPERALDAAPGGVLDADAQLLQLDAAAVQSVAEQLLREDQMVRVVVLPQSAGLQAPVSSVRALPKRVLAVRGGHRHRR